MEEESRIDLRLLDPDADAGAEGRFMDAVMARVARLPAPEAMPSDPLTGVWSIMRSPALAAGILLVVAAGALGMRMRGEDERPQTLVQAVGVPPAFLASANGQGEEGR